MVNLYGVQCNNVSFSLLKNLQIRKNKNFKKQTKYVHKIGDKNCGH